MNGDERPSFKFALYGSRCSVCGYPARGFRDYSDRRIIDHDGRLPCEVWRPPSLFGGRS